MYLKKLEINGFKSFAKKTVLEFQPGITSVVGPNGSGKSNIADSLRWAFGEQSMKTLRGRKTEDVIFAGSDQKAKLGAAEAFVYFDNSDHNIPIDFSEVVIGRRLYRDGTSEYLINGSKVRLLDIQEILSKSGFGNSSYHVIGQGMIDQLILGGPTAIKELIEEAAGIKPYYVKRDRTLRRLLKTDTNLEQVRALLKEIKPRLRSLERQAKRLEQRDDIEQKLRLSQAQYFKQVFAGSIKHIHEIDNQINGYDQQVYDLISEIDKLSAEIEEEEDKTVKAGDTQGEKAKKLQELRSIRQELFEQRAVIKGEMTALDSHPQIIKVDWEKVKGKIKSVYSRLKDFFGRIDALRENPDVQKKIVSELEQEFEQVIIDLEGNKGQSEEKINELKIRLRGFDLKIEQTRKEVEDLENQISAQTEAEGGAKKQLFVKERLLRNKQDALVKTRDQKNQLSVERARLTTRQEGYEQEAIEALGNDYPKVIEELTDDGPAPVGIQEKISRLKTELSRIGGVDDLTLQEYKETQQRYEYLSHESADLEKASTDLRTIIKDLDEIIKNEFNHALGMISERFSEYFRILFGGGKATMSPFRRQIGVEEEEDFEGEIEEELTHQKHHAEVVGVQIKATPPGKKLSGIAALSGGERALTAIALLSAMLASYPSPFVVLDEVDAALDEANSIRFGKILGTLADRTQFITITHNRETMRQSHTLYGVTMGEDGVSRILSLKLEEAAVYSTKN